MKTTKKKSTERNVSTPPAAVPAPGVSDARIMHLTMSRDALLREMYHPAPSASESNLRGQMQEFEQVVSELAKLKERRNAQPITPYTVTLDEHASRLVRSILHDDPGFTVADVVNGAVYFNVDGDHNESPECFEAARAARLALEGKEGN